MCVLSKILSCLASIMFFCGLLFIENKSSDDITLSVSISVDIIVTLHKSSCFCEAYYEYLSELSRLTRVEKAVKNTTIVVTYKVLVYIQMSQPTTRFDLF